MSEIQTPPPSPPAPTDTSAPKVLATLAAAFGGFLVFASLCGLLAYLILPLRDASGALENNILLGSVISIGLIGGGLLLIAGLAVRQGLLTRDLPTPSPWIFVGVFVLVLVLGQTVLLVNLATAYLFPPWHVLASAMLPLAALAYAARRLPQVASRTVLAQMAWGSIGTLLPALVLELLVGSLLAVAGAVILALLIGPDQVFALIRSIVNGPREPERILNLLTREPTVLIVGGVVAIILFVITGPLIEELIKSLGPAALIARAHPTRGAALLWGLAAGAGFAFSENLLNGASGATSAQSPESLWASVMVLRAGTSLVHMAATATVSLGWHAAFVQHRRARLALLFLTALTAHGFWNLIALGLGAVSSAVFSNNRLSSGLSAIVGVFALMILLLLILASAGWIAWLIRWARNDDRRQTDDGSERRSEIDSGGLPSAVGGQP